MRDAETKPLSRGMPQFMLRLPDGLRDAIKLEAVKNRRSMNAEIVVQLERIYSAETETAGASAKSTPTA